VRLLLRLPLWNEEVAEAVRKKKKKYSNWKKINRGMEGVE